jgi:hypothetical protein
MPDGRRGSNQVLQHQKAPPTPPPPKKKKIGMPATSKRRTAGAQADDACSKPRSSTMGRTDKAFVHSVASIRLSIT